MNVRLTANLNKAIEALLYLMGLARSAQLTQYQLLKALFIADSGHSDLYGRPITFCNYVAMENGPVPSEAYDLLKGKVLNKADIIDSSWQARGVEGSKKIFFTANRQANTELLSVSDMKMLEKGYEFVISNDFGKVRDETHKHLAYEEAWSRRENMKSVDMKLELLAGGDRELALDMAHASKYFP